jgi:hypothetical protein
VVSLKLVGAMNCDSIAAPVYDVNSPLIAYLQLSETAFLVQAEKGDG